MTDASGPSAPSPMKQRGGGTALAAVTAGAAGLLAVYDSAWRSGSAPLPPCSWRFAKAAGRDELPSASRAQYCGCA